MTRKFQRGDLVWAYNHAAVFERYCENGWWCFVREGSGTEIPTPCVSVTPRYLSPLHEAVAEALDG